MSRYPEVLTTGDCARMLRCSQQHVIRCCDQGLLKHYKLPGSRFRRVRREWLVEFANKHNIPLEGVGNGVG